MTYDEMIEMLRDQTGKTVEVSVFQLAEAGQEPVHVAGFWGRVDRICRTPTRAGRPEAWYVYLAQDEPGPSTPHVRLERTCFSDADVQANVPDEPEERSSVGSTWTLTVRLDRTVIEFEVYV